MAHSEKCPVCNGSGVTYEVWVDLPQMRAAEDSKEVPCHGCNGKGWVEVDDEIHAPDKKRADKKVVPLDEALALVGADNSITLGELMKKVRSLGIDSFWWEA